MPPLDILSYLAKLQDYYARERIIPSTTHDRTGDLGRHRPAGDCRRAMIDPRDEAGRVLAAR